MRETEFGAKRRVNALKRHYLTVCVIVIIITIIITITICYYIRMTLSEIHLEENGNTYNEMF